jgi:hypothetical protein
MRRRLCDQLAPSRESSLKAGLQRGGPIQHARLAAPHPYELLAQRGSGLRHLAIDVVVARHHEDALPRDVQRTGGVLQQLRHIGILVRIVPTAAEREVPGREHRIDTRESLGKLPQAVPQVREHDLLCTAIVPVAVPSMNVGDVKPGEQARVGHVHQAASRLLIWRRGLLRSDNARAHLSKSAQPLLYRLTFRPACARPGAACAEAQGT